MVKNLPHCRRPGCETWVEKSSWRGEWLPTPVFLPGEFHCSCLESSIKQTGELQSMDLQAVRYD